MVGPGGIPGTPEQTGRLLPFGVLVMFAGPSVAGILLTGLVDGKAGLRALLSRLLKWRVGARWYAVALLTAPLLTTATLFALWLISPAFRPGIFASDHKAVFLLSGIAAGLGTVLEELGWTGFAVPRMRLRYGVFATGLVVGILWGAWHFLTNVWASGTSTGALFLLLFLAGDFFAVGVLPAYRVLMVWVYDRTGSLLVATLMHASLTSSWLILMPLPDSGVPVLIWYLLLAAALWVVVAAVAVANRDPFSRRPLGARVARNG